MVVVDRFLGHLIPVLGGHWSWFTGGHCSELVLLLKLLWWDFGWSLLTGGRYLEVLVNTGLTVLSLLFILKVN